MARNGVSVSTEILQDIASLKEKFMSLEKVLDEYIRSTAKDNKEFKSYVSDRYHKHSETLNTHEKNIIILQKDIESIRDNIQKNMTLIDAHIKDVQEKLKTFNGVIDSLSKKAMFIFGGAVVIGYMLDQILKFLPKVL